MTNAEPKGRGLKWKGLAKTEYGYKRRCGGEDGRGVQEKTAARSADAQDQWTRLDTEKANKKLNIDITADAAGRTGAGCRKRQRRAAQTRETKGTWLDTKNRARKANEKTEYGYKRAARGRSGRAAGVGGESSFRSKICSNC